MTSGMAGVVEHSTLTLGRRLGQGGQGTVHEVANKKINQVGGDGWDVVYKEYNPAALPNLDADALTAMVNLLNELSGADGKWLCEKAAWPAAVVERDGHACGFLMRAVPDRFQFAMRGLTTTTTGTRRLANLEYLLNDDTYIAGIGLRVSDQDRLALLADLAAALTRLHRHGITVGDLSPKNLLFTTAPQSEVFLIDSDAMRLRGATALPQAETPDWQIPAGEEKATRGSDIYKLGLLAVRLFAQDQTTTDPTTLAATNPALGDLARASLDTDPTRRPTPSSWAEQLIAAIPTASTIPTPAPQPQGRSAAKPPSHPASRRPPRSPATAGRTRSGTPSAALKAVGAAVAVGAVILTIAITNSHDNPGAAPNTSPTYAYTTAPTYTTTATSTTRPYSTPQYQPPPPPPMYYGALAVGTNGAYGQAWDFDSSDAAAAHAMNGCTSNKGTRCKVLIDFVNGCGAIAYNRATRMYWGGRGATETEAKNNAIANAGGGGWYTWACTTR